MPVLLRYCYTVRMQKTDTITITECPRDSWQGLAKFIPTEDKIGYLKRLIRAGARRIDFGSFVSPKAVPQMADSATVFENIASAADDLYLIGIIGNARGLEGLLACNGKFKHKGRISAAGYPMSVSPTFQQRNLGRSLDQSWDEFAAICAKAIDHKVDVICYLSMAFGNPYDDPHSSEIVIEAAKRAASLGVTTISLADTIGSAEPAMISELFQACMSACPEVTFTAHLHSTPDGFAAKIDAAVDAGCRLIDSALAGVGGCPFAKDDLTGNVDTMLVLKHLQARGFATSLDPDELTQCAAEAARIASVYSAT